MKYKSFILFLLLILLASLTFIFTTYFLSEKVVHAQELPVSFEIVEHHIIGINVETDSLKFGSIGVGNSASRKITVINPFDFQVKVSIDFNEEIKKFISSSENNFILDVKANKTFPITVEVPENARFGNYTGVMNLVMRKA